MCYEMMKIPQETKGSYKLKSIKLKGEKNKFEF